MGPLLAPHPPVARAVGNLFFLAGKLAQALPDL